MKRQLTRFAFMSNPYRVIKLLVFVTGFCIVSCTTALAQQSFFVYLQSESWQPFYVQIGDKVYSSSSIGHLVIANLPDQTCSFEVGFPQHTIQPQRFSIPLHNRDHGYQLVKNGSRGWALQDWQTDEIIKPLKDAGNTTILYGERKNDDPFANLMAAVVNDSSVLYTSIVKKESTGVPNVASAGDKPVEKPAEKQEVKVEEKAVVIADSAVATTKVEKVDVVTAPNPPPVETANLAKTGVTVDTAQTQNVIPVDSAVTKYDPKERGLNEKPGKPAGVAKIQQQTKDGETKMVFVDSSESPVKVVTVYIEEDKKAAETAPAADVAKPQPKQEVVLPSVKQEMQVEVVTNNENVVVKKDTVKAAAPVTKEVVAEQIKKETWRAAPEKKASSSDTTTIILESNQMKKAAATEEQPLYRPKEEAKTEPVKPVVEETPKAVVTLPIAKEEKIEVKQQPVKPVVAEEAKKESEPVAVKTDKELAKPAVDAAVTVVKTEPQPVVEVKKPESEKPKAVEPEKKAEAPGKLVMINSDCAKLATDNDVDKMRVKMMAESDLQKKLTVANKYFKTMCLYAKQIKGLSELFPNDEGRYKFLEMAYPFAADTANFKQLYELLSAEEYVTKFKKLVRLQ